MSFSRVISIEKAAMADGQNETEKSAEIVTGDKISIPEMSEENDDELDKLLDDALDDFEKPQPKKKNPMKYSEKTKDEKESNSSKGEPLDTLFDDDALFRMTSDLNNVLGQMAEADPAMMAEFQKFQEESGENSEFTLPKDFSIDENIAKTMEDLTKNLESLGTDGSTDSFQDILKQMQTGLDGDDLGEDSSAFGDSFMGMMQGMMENLLSKDLLYPSLKEIEDKYPSWLSENKEKISSTDHEKYLNQSKIVSKLCRIFEEETENDSDITKQERQVKVVELMQQMQKYGQPPADMMADIVGEGGAQATPPMQDCSIM